MPYITFTQGILKILNKVLGGPVHNQGGRGNGWWGSGAFFTVTQDILKILNKVWGRGCRVRREGGAAAVLSLSPTDVTC